MSDLIARLKIHSYVKLRKQYAKQKPKKKNTFRFTLCFRAHNISEIHQNFITINPCKQWHIKSLEQQRAMHMQ